MKYLKLLTLIALITFTACKKEETTSNGGAGSDPSGGGNGGGNGGSSPSTEYYFQGTISGDNILLESTKNDYSITNGSQDAGNIKKTYSALANSQDKNSFEVTIIKDLGKSNPTPTEIYNIFQTGSVNFSNKTDDGVVVNWKNENGYTFTSDLSYIAQGGSSFNITSVSAMSDYKFKVTGTVNCKLFGLTDTKTLENGSFSIIFDASL